MRIGLISDTHIPEARHELWPQVFHAFRNVDYILHAGDIHDLSVLDRLSEVATTYAARGNGDEGIGGRPRQPDDPRLKDVWVLELDGLRIGLVHDMPIPENPPHLLVENALIRHFKRTDLDIVVYGDTHVESIDRINGILCVNPGSPTYPHNLNTQHGTIGFLESAPGARPQVSIWQITDEGIEPFTWGRWGRPW